MRYEQIIATVARRLAIAEVREIKVVETFAAAMRLHLWLLRTSLGMPAYSGSDPSPTGDTSWINTGNPGCKRGRLQSQPLLVTAGCPAGLTSA